MKRCAFFLVALFSFSSLVSAKPPKTEPFQVGFKVGKGVTFRSLHDYVVLRVKLRGQFRSTVEHRAADDLWKQGMQIKRARLAFSGSMLGKQNRFGIQLAFSPSDMGLKNGVVRKIPLLDWYMHFTHFRELNIRLGQYKVPYSRERIASSAKLAMLDRSIVDSALKLDRDMGVELLSRDFLGLKKLRYFAGLYMGDGASASKTGDFGLMYLIRLEFAPFGMFKGYDQIDFSRSEAFRLSIGGSYVFVDRSRTDQGIGGAIPADGGTTNSHHVEADILAKWRGFTLHSEFLLRQGRRTSGGKKDSSGRRIPTALPRNGMGFFVLLSYLLPKLPLSVAARYSSLFPLGSSTETNFSEKSELGAALTYHFAFHSLKLGADFFHFWYSSGFSKGDDRLRVQLEASF